MNNIQKTLVDIKKYSFLSLSDLLSLPKLELEFLKNLKKNFKFATIPSLSYVSNSASIREGSMIHHFAIVNRDASVGSNSIINTSIVEHDVKVGNNCHISTGSIVNGGVIGDGTFVGSGSVIKEGVKIGKNCIIGMGTIVKKDLKNFSVLK